VLPVFLGILRQGCTHEGCSKKSEIAPRLGTAYRLSLQGNDPSILVTSKHYLGDGGTAWGTSTTPEFLIDQGNTQLTEAQMRQLLLPHLSMRLKMALNVCDPPYSNRTLLSTVGSEEHRAVAQLVVAKLLFLL
jgi:beta-glucosidase